MDAKDGIFDFLSTISDSVLEKSDKLVNDDSDKKLFVKMLSRMFALLLNTKVNIAEKIKQIIKITIERPLKIWQEPRQQ